MNEQLIKKEMYVPKRWKRQEHKQAEAEKERKREERCANMGKEGREKEGVQELNVV